MLINNNVSLRPYNTFGIDAAADSFVDADNVDELIDYLTTLDNTSQTLILGGGSNILFVSERCGLVIHPAWKGIQPTGAAQDGNTAQPPTDRVFVTAAAGETWDDFVAWTVDNGYSGLENLSGIPGTVGASAVQNIGAYGVEASEFIVNVEAFDLMRKKRVFLNRKECAFKYRSSLFKYKSGRYLVLSVTYQLFKMFRPKLNYAGLQTALAGNNLTSAAMREAVLDIRRTKLPDYHELGNAGSFFKNPVVPRGKADELRRLHPGIPMFVAENKSYKASAAWLIDQCGWKGIRHGNVGCYEHHSLILVNHGGASGKEVMAFAGEITASVVDKFGIRLEPEVVIL